MVNFYLIANDHLMPCNREQGELLIYTEPDAAELKFLENAYGISSHNISSSLDPDELGRLEWEEDHWSMIVKIPKNYSSSDNFLFKVTSVGIFIWRDRIILVSNSEVLPVLEAKQSFKLKTLYDVLLKVLFGTIFHFLGHLKVINLISDSLEQKINASMANEHLLDMFTIEKSLVYYLNGIHSNGAVFEKIRSNAGKIGFSADNMEFLDDIIIENNQCKKQAEIYSDILTGLMDARGSIVNNNLNLLIKRLTIVSVVFMPLNVIAGIFGMSEFSAMTDGIPHWISYGLFTVGLVGVAFLTYWVLKLLGIDTSGPNKKKKDPRAKSRRAI